MNGYMFSEEVNDGTVSHGVQPEVFITQTSMADDQVVPKQTTTQSVSQSNSITKMQKKSSTKHEWDEYLLSILSKPTAQWIVTQKTNPADRRYKVRLQFKRVINSKW